MEMSTWESAYLNQMTLVNALTAALFLLGAGLVLVWVNMPRCIPPHRRMVADIVFIASIVLVAALITARAVGVL